jgi:hypothetical protein
MYLSRFMPCEGCGESLDLATSTPVHSCDPQRRVDFQMFALRDDIGTFEAHLHRHLDTPDGRFEAWLAARQVRQER